MFPLQTKFISTYLYNDPLIYIFVSYTAICMQYTPDQILQLAPDDASAKAGQQLANTAKWVSASQHSIALWGDCQGSGKTPYKTVIDLSNIAFKCTCPSRKFPCKHGLGLMLLYAQRPDVFNKENDLPPHVSEWLGKRREKEVPKDQKEEKPVDEEAKAKRVAAREKKVASGIDELQFWIKDVIRSGIMSVPQDAYNFSKNITARMVDAQAGGLAAQLRQIDKIDFYKDGWQRQLTRRLSGIYLISEAYNNLAQMPPDVATELRTLIGWSTPKEEVLQRDVIADTWVVLSAVVTEDDNISTSRTWLYGMATGRFAVLLDFYAGGQLPQQVLFPGMHIKASVCYYPGSSQMRCLIKEHEVLPAHGIAIHEPRTALTVHDRLGTQLSQAPFTEQLPFLLAEARIIYASGKWHLKDELQEGLVLSNTEDECWRMLAFTKGRAAACFGIYEHERFYIHSLWSNDKFFFAI